MAYFVLIIGIVYLIFVVQRLKAKLRVVELKAKLDLAKSVDKYEMLNYAYHRQTDTIKSLQDDLKTSRTNSLALKIVVNKMIAKSEANIHCLKTNPLLKE